MNARLCSRQPAMRPLSPIVSSRKMRQDSLAPSFSGRSIPTPSRSDSVRMHAAWIENSAQVDVPVALETCWTYWEDRESIPKWMPWIASVKVQENDTKMSRWLLKTEQFGRSWEFSWVAQNLTPIKYQKIHWRSVQGSTAGSLGGAIDVPNRGEIRFYRKSPTSCSIKLTISYEVPQIANKQALTPFANALTPLVESILLTDMNRFSKYAQEKGGVAV